MIVKAHVITAAMEVFGMSDLNDVPNECIVPPGLASSSQYISNGYSI